jgi:hypothetical protein
MLLPLTHLIFISEFVPHCNGMGSPIPLWTYLFCINSDYIQAQMASIRWRHYRVRSAMISVFWSLLPRLPYYQQRKPTLRSHIFFFPSTGLYSAWRA